MKSVKMEMELNYEKFNELRYVLKDLDGNSLPEHGGISEEFGVTGYLRIECSDGEVLDIVLYSSKDI